MDIKKMLIQAVFVLGVVYIAKRVKPINDFIG